MSERKAIRDGMEETPHLFHCFVVVKILLILDAQILKSNVMNFFGLHKRRTAPLASFL